MAPRRAGRGELSPSFSNHVHGGNVSDSQVVQRVVPPRPGRVSARSVACLFRAGGGAESNEPHVLQQGRQPADTDALPTCGGWPGRGLLGLERVRQVGVWCWPPFLKLSQGVSSQSLVPGFRGRAGQSVGGSPGPKPQVSGGIGGGLEIPSWVLGLSRQVSWACAAASWGQRVHSLTSQVTGPPGWQGSHPATWVCLSRKCRHGSERSCETPGGQSFRLKPTS